MTSRLAVPGLIRFTAGLVSAFAIIAALALSVSLVGAAAGDVTLVKSSDASDPELPGGTYTYTLLATNTAAAQVTNVLVSDGSLDPGQLTVDSADFVTSGGQNGTCVVSGTNVDCPVGTLEADETATVTIDVTLAALNEACPDNGKGGIDDTILNRSDVEWTDTDGSFTTTNPPTGTPAHRVDIDCTGAPPPTSTPVPSVTPAPTATPTPTPTGTPTPTATPTPTPSANPFTDINSSQFKNDILYIYNAGITGGCTSTTYCPTNNVLRDQMASFLVRALKLPPTSVDYFDDDEGNQHENQINALAQAGVTGGCGVRRYCPDSPVKRDQMASFLVRAFKLPPTIVNFFSDDNGNQHENQINALANSGITGGCATARYCPSGLVTRGQMAAFLHRALD
ncbi:MAG: S-layer homology domain-containing protein [Candidatus Limnocylindria bacterium]